MEKETKKIKILALGDNIMFNSGVGIQARYVLEGLAATGRYEILQLAGAKDHPSYEPFKHNDNIVIKPVKGYGNKMELRIAMDQWKPDAIWMITDPRFYTWLFEMADEILGRCPIFYWHVWDNDPAPTFNKPFYDSCTYVGCISKLTHTLLKDMGYDNADYIPHAVPRDIFKPVTKEEKTQLRRKFFPNNKNIENKFILLWIGVNAARKRLGDMLVGFNKVLETHPDSVLIVKTKINVDESVNPIKIVQNLCPNIKLNENVFIMENVSDKNNKNQQIFREFTDQEMAELYNLSDVLVNNSSHEGFGLSVLQSLYTATPPIVLKTGGMTGQLTDQDHNQTCGVLMDPKSRVIMGNIVVPYIYEDLVGPIGIAEEINKFMSQCKDDPKYLDEQGQLCLEKSKEFSIKRMVNQWDDAIQKYSQIHHETYIPYSITTF